MGSLPLYMMIANELIKSIENGEYKKNEKLPTESKLCKIYNVSRITIRQALHVLVQKQYIEKIQGSGTYVIYSKTSVLIGRSSKIISFSDEMRMKNIIPSAKIVDFRLVKSDKQLSEELNTELGTNLIYYERILLGDDFPYCFEKGYLPVSLFSDITIKNLEKSKIEYIEKEKNIEIGYSHQVVRALMPDQKLHDLLKVKLNTPLIEITHVTYTPDDIPIEKTSIIFDSNLYQAHFIKYRK